MTLLIIFAFVAGLVTILSPCILPMLPIILSSSGDKSGKHRPFGVVIGFVLSFSFFTLFLSSIVRLSGIPSESLRYLSILVLAVFGLSLFIPEFQLRVSALFSRLTRFAPQGTTSKGFPGGLIIGFSLGLLWTPCVGPILASVISLAISGTVTLQAAVITLAYSLGTALPMFLLIQFGSTALQKIPWLTKNSEKIQKLFGVLMVLTALAIFFNIDRKFQTYIINTFPQYGVGLTQIEDNATVKTALLELTQKPTDNTLLGKPMLGVPLAKGPVAPEIIAGGDWFNSVPLKLTDLKGKVVVLDFWTYSCINCQRTFPYLRQWYEKYKDKGLVIIGVHSPEFEFEKSPSNVAQAIKDFQLTYPIVQDNNFATWRAYDNQYWPAKYFVDKDGNIRYSHFGEGDYDESEQVIQQLLNEAGAQGVANEISNPRYQVYANTPETYLGYGRLNYNKFASPERVVEDGLASYTAAQTLRSNEFAYAGDWIIKEEFANPQQGANLTMNFNAAKVYLVMRTNNGAPAKVKVFVDGNNTSVVTIDGDKLYTLVDLATPGQHLLRLEFDDSSTEVYAFTFG